MESQAAGPQHLPWPQDLVAQVLQHVPQRQRLTSCALVSRSWRTAALAATTSVDVPRSDDISTSGINSWLLQHGSNLRSLSLARNRDDSYWENSWEPALLLLPFQHLRQLQHLDLQQLVVQQYQAGGGLQGGSWADMAMLTSICLHIVNLQTQGTYAALSALTTLQSLQLTRPLTNPPSSSQIAIDLAPLSQLTGLSVDNLSEASMSALSNLPLAHLRLGTPPPKPCILQHLPVTLSTLGIGGFSIVGGQILSVSTSSTPRLRELTGLKHLHLTGYMTLEPSVLSSLVKLTHLAMDFVTLVPEDNIGTRAFLSILPCFMELRHLSLPSTLKWSLHQLNGGQTQAYSTLLSSTGLTCLDLTECELPGSVMRHILQDRQTALKVLRIQPAVARSIETLEDLQRVVHCCPSLQELCLVRATKPDLRLTSLGQLSNLTSLTFGGQREQSAHAIEDIISSGLHLKLKQLTLRSIPNLAPMDLLSLRQFTNLTRLKISDCDYKNEDRYIKLSSKADPLDVWKQFEEVCLRNGIGADVLLQERIADVDHGSQRTIATLEQKLREEHDSRVTCERRASQLEQQVQHLKRQLEEAQQSNLAQQQQLQQSHQQPENVQNAGVVKLQKQDF